MSETVLFYTTGAIWSCLVNLTLCHHHEISPLDLSLLQRNLCLVFFLGVASFGEFTHPLPKVNRVTRFKSKSTFVKLICIPVVRAALEFLLNTLSYFHVFLPIDHSFGLRATYSLYNSDSVYWNSTRPVGCLKIPDNFFYNRDDHLPMLDICVHADPSLQQYDPSYPMKSSFREHGAYGRYTRFASHPHLLPKS